MSRIVRGFAYERPLQVLSGSGEEIAMAKRVGIVHYTSPSESIGGVELVIDYQARLLSQAGYEVHLISGDEVQGSNPNIIEHSIPLLSPGNKRVVQVQEQILRERRMTQDFELLKKDIKTGVLEALSDIKKCIVHNIPSMPFNFAGTAAISEITDESRVQMIYWLHDSVLLREEWKDRIGEFPVSLLHHKNPKTVYVAPTHFRAKQFGELPVPYDIGKVTVIPNGVSIEEYIKIDETTKALLKRLGLAFENYIVVTPVRVTPRKNIELALQVIDELKHLVGPAREIRLLITGPPDHMATKMGMAYLEYLKEIIEKRGLREDVIFCHEVINQKREFENGHIKKWGVADVYNVADLVFIPSKEEGFGLPVIEAGASRKPIFCSRIPPFQELLRDDIEGSMFDLDEDPKSIAFRIYRSFLEDKVESNFHNVMKRFDWERVILTRLLSLLSGLPGGS
jgi:glycosyltransferase involved in cell wall biosynthesis